MVIGGVGVLVLIFLVGLLAAGVITRRPALTMGLAGLALVSGVVLMLGIDDLLGTVALVFGLVLGVVALWRDAKNRRQNQAQAS